MTLIFRNQSFLHDLIVITPTNVLHKCNVCPNFGKNQLDHVVRRAVDNDGSLSGARRFDSLVPLRISCFGRVSIQYR